MKATALILTVLALAPPLSAFAADGKARVQTLTSPGCDCTSTSTPDPDPYVVRG